MREIGVLEAEHKLGALLDLVQGGEEIVITRQGKAVARLVREAGKADKQRAVEAARDIRALAKSLQLGPFDWDEWKEARDVGRP